jgi:hypothetical protein
VTTNLVSSGPTSLQLAFDARLAVTSLRRPGLRDDANNFIVQLIDSLFDAMLAAPCASPAEIVRNAKVIMAEYRCGDAVPQEIQSAFLRGLFAKVRERPLSHIRRIWTN